MEMISFNKSLFAQLLKVSKYREEYGQFLLFFSC